jgi:hypothetical protein
MKIACNYRLACTILFQTVSGTALAVPQGSPLQGMGPDQVNAIHAACADDIQKFCATVPQGGGRVVACLKEHKDSLSDPCRQAGGLPPKASGGVAPGAAATTATATVSAAPPSNAAEKSNLKSAGKIKAASEPVSVAGERFVKRSLVDAQQGGMNAVSLYLPEKWRFEGKIEWHYGWIEVPVNPSWHAENPANEEAYFQFESLRLANIDVAPQYRQYVKAAKPGDRYPTGQISLAPLPPLQTMALFIKQTRGDVTNLKWIGQQDLPGLAKALRLDSSPNQHGVAIKIGYDLNGKPVEEAFFGVYYLNKSGNQAVQAGHQAMAANQLIQTNWGLQALQSFRAPAGTLDRRMPVYCLIAKSVQFEPQWTTRYRTIEAALLQAFNQKLQQGWDQIRAADAISDRAVANNNAFLENIGRQETAMRDSGGGGGVDGFLRDEGGRSSSDRFSDLIRGVDTLNDPSTGGTKQLDYSGGFNHFTDGFGNYRTYDDPNATPENQGENGSWTRMTLAP